MPKPKKKKPPPAAKKTMDINPHDLYADHETEEPAPAADMLAARQMAIEILLAVLDRKQPLDDALAGSATFAALPGRDKAFCRMITGTVLRRLGQIDALIARAQDKPATLHPLIQTILRIGAAQIFFMEVPDHAAVDTAVRLTDAFEMDRQKGFVNAMLRTLTRDGHGWLGAQDPLRLNTPDWLLKSWITDYGLSSAVKIAEAHLSEAPLDLSIKDSSAVQYWAENLHGEIFAADTVRIRNSGPVSDMIGFDDGMWWVQDASAAIPAALFGPVKDKTVIDFCAAPGGKTMQLAARGAHVIAIDRSAPRLKRLQDNLGRLRLQDRVEIVASDAAVWRPAQAPEAILLDAPCSATGTIRRHPDVAYLKSERDIERLARVQADLLAHGFDILAPGGILIYCTCSLQKAEGEAQISRLLAERPDSMKLPIRAEEIGGIAEAVTEDGDLRILPFHQGQKGGMDGFFISRVKKTG